MDIHIFFGKKIRHLELIYQINTVFRIEHAMLDFESKGIIKMK